MLSEEENNEALERILHTDDVVVFSACVEEGHHKVQVVATILNGDVKERTVIIERDVYGTEEDAEAILDEVTDYYNSLHEMAVWN